jgi:protein-S-isoprenylcysteine O-methyltransferase Ste14
LDVPTLSNITIAGVMLGWVVFAAGILLRARGQPAVKRARERASVAAIVVQGIGFGLVWGFRRAPHTMILPMPIWVGFTLTILAIVIAVGSAWMGARAIRILGKQWSLEARIREDHELITAGPYAVVRHPIYTAMLGLLIGTGLAVSQPLAFLAGTIVFIAGTMVRVRLEERLLRAGFGASYEAYASRVPAFVPWLKL